MNSYTKILKTKQIDPSSLTSTFQIFFAALFQQKKEPYPFGCFHKAMRSPIDYYQMGLEIIRPLIDLLHSKLHGQDQLVAITNSIMRGENVFLFGNHQIEAEPQVISLMLEEKFPHLAKEMIFVAGQRVTTDPFTVPFSLGRNLFCIYSKRYFDSFPDTKHEMQEHNTKTILTMKTHLNEGGKCIYVAPSGGRDRLNSDGILTLDPFDPRSIDLMYLLGRHCKPNTSYYPLALSTHHILPPPTDIISELGEERITNEGAVHLYFGPKIDMEHFKGSDAKNKKEKSVARTNFIYSLVKNLYDTFPL